MKMLMARSRPRRWLVVFLGCLALGVIIIVGKLGAATAYQDEVLGGVNAHDATVYSQPQAPHLEFISTAGPDGPGDGDRDRHLRRQG